jgi:hypothetical protein
VSLWSFHLKLPPVLKKHIVFFKSLGWLSFRESRTQICLILSSWCHLTCPSVFGNSYKVKVRSRVLIRFSQNIFGMW